MSLIAALALGLLPQPQADDPRPKPLQDLEAARQEVQFLQLLNELKLSQQAVERILECVDETARVLTDFVEQNRSALEDAQKLLADIRATLEKGGTVTEDQQRAVSEITRALDEKTKAMGEQLKGTGEKLRGALTDKQVLRLSVLNTNNPLGKLRTQLRQGIAQVRQLPDDQFEANVPTAIETQVGRIAEGLGGLSDDDIQSERDRIMQILRDARNLGDDEFDKKAAELVDKILTEGKLGDLATKSVPKGPEVNQALAKVFMSPRVVAILRKRLELMKGGQIPTEDK
jgi:hypothetical protein